LHCSVYVAQIKRDIWIYVINRRGEATITTFNTDDFFSENIFDGTKLSFAASYTVVATDMMTNKPPNYLGDTTDFW